MAVQQYIGQQEAGHLRPGGHQDLVASGHDAARRQQPVLDLFEQRVVVVEVVLDAMCGQSLHEPVDEQVPPGLDVKRTALGPAGIDGQQTGRRCGGDSSEGNGRHAGGPSARLRFRDRQRVVPRLRRAPSPSCLECNAVVVISAAIIQAAA